MGDSATNVPLASSRDALRLHQVSVLYELTSCLGQSLDLESSLGEFLRRLLHALNGDAGAIFVQVPGAVELTGARLLVGSGGRCASATGLSLPFHVAAEIPTTEGMLALSSGAADDCPALRDAAKDLLPDWRNLICLPLHTGHRRVGVMLLLFAANCCFGPDTSAMLRDLARRAALTTDHLLSHAELRDSEQRYRTLMMSAADPILLYDPIDGGIVDCNGAAEHATGRSREALVGGDVPRDLRQHLRHPLHQAKSPLVLSLRAPDGEERVFEAARQALTVGDRELVLALLRDITVRMSLERDLMAASEAAMAAVHAKSRFLANMSHEIRTPMNGILGMANIMLLGALPDEVRQQLEVIRASADSLLDIVNDVLDLSKLEAGRMRLVTEPFDLRATIRDVLSVAGGLGGGRPLRLAATADPALPGLLIGDAGRVRQVLLNLIGNAVKFTSEGSVTVQARVVDQDKDKVRVRVEVVDTGIGITAEDAAQLFRPFVQVEQGAARRHGGTGLGLAICHNLITLMGGEIGVDSEPGQGSTFWFEVTWSTTCSGATALPAACPTRAPLRSARILVAEDHPVNALVAEKLLQKLGHQPTVARDGHEALRRLASEHFDLAFMDCQMPGLDGYQATLRWRETESAAGRQHLPIIAFTAAALAGDRERCLTAGMDDHLVKPVRLPDLQAVLARWLPAQPPVPTPG